MNIPKNLKILTKEELDFINSKYTFWCDDTFIYHRPITRNYTSIHPKNKRFTLLMKGYKKLTFTTLAMSVFSKMQTQSDTIKYSLVDIQNAINTCMILRQPVTEENILKVLQGNAKISEI